jgi:hypothetical protein
MTDFPLAVTITAENVEFTGRANDLSRRLLNEGVAFVGLSRDRIDFADGVTQEAQDLANGILAAWDWDAPPVPAEVSPLQAALALQAFGRLAGVEAAVAAGGQLAQLAWQRASVFRRDSQLLAEIAAAVPGLADQLDDIFRAAAKIAV